jgi:hypothetical protein
MSEQPNKNLVTDDECEAVARAMDFENKINWQSPDHEHAVARENAMRIAKQHILAARAVGTRVSKGEKTSRDPDLVKESNVGGDSTKLGKGERWETPAENRAADRADAKAAR